MITVGIDVGSLSTKAVVIDQKKRILSFHIELTKGDNVKAVKKVFSKTLKKARVSERGVNYIVTTGYGRDNVSFSDKQVTEITCHALGSHFLFPEVRTIIDIGGQDSKGINIDENGQVLDFVMNDKCAAGSGRFLEVMAHAMGVGLRDLERLSEQSKRIVPISNMCTVFAESEVVSLVSEGCSKSDIIKGVHESIAERSIILLNKINIVKSVTMTGGVAKNKGVVCAIENHLGLKMHISVEPQIVGALGAALIGLQS